MRSMRMRLKVASPNTCTVRCDAPRRQLRAALRASLDIVADVADV